MAITPYTSPFKAKTSAQKLAGTSTSIQSGNIGSGWNQAWANGPGQALSSPTTTDPYTYPSTPPTLPNIQDYNVTKPVDIKAPTGGWINTTSLQPYEQKLAQGAEGGSLGALDTSNAWNNPMVTALGQAGQTRLDAGMAALQKLFGTQTESERERVASRGLVGAGAENEMLRRLAGEQGSQAQQFIAETQADTMEKQSAAAMQVLGINNDRDIANLDARLKTQGMNLEALSNLYAQKADILKQQGALDQATAASNQAAALDWANNRMKQYEIDTNSALEDFKNRVLAFQAVSEDDARTQELISQRLQALAASGIDGEDLRVAVNDMMEGLGLDPLFPQSGTSQQNAASTAGQYSTQELGIPPGYSDTSYTSPSGTVYVKIPSTTMGTQMWRRA